MIDFHAHILPDFDDGPDRMEEALLLIKELMDQGVETIVSTSHFYSYEEGLEDFIRRRDKAFDSLKEATQDLEINLVKGAEVYCSETLLLMTDFSEISIEGTPVILLELPEKKPLSSQLVKIIQKLTNRHSLIPLIAHAERYPELIRMSTSGIKKLKKMGCLIQVNTSSILSKSKYHKVALKMLDRGLVDIIGTDSHGTSFRRPSMYDARQELVRLYGQDFFDQLMDNARNLIMQKSRDSLSDMWT